jgi:hypothetical protein
MRKRWTPKTEVTDALLQFREKRKWQIALRRYVLEKNKCSFYAPYYGLDITRFRKWIELQFEEDLDWDNFSTAWQFDHIIPIAYFDFSNDFDLRLCWNFINIRVENINNNKSSRIDILRAKTYFEHLHRSTGFSLCKAMVEKIEHLEQSQIHSNTVLEEFIVQNKPFAENALSFASYEFNKLNEGVLFEEIMAEQELLKKFGGI